MTKPSPTARPGPTTSTPPRQRGTVLLMVIGVLALLAIIAVVYATLGRSDRATSAALVRAQRVEDRSSEIAKYLQGVISDGVFSVRPQRAENGQQVVVKRNAADFPWTDANFLSVNVANSGDLLTISGALGLPNPDPLYNGVQLGDLSLDPFRPTGSMFNRWRNNAIADLRNFGVPFLAATEPTFLGHLTGSSTASAKNEALSPDDALANRRDWPHISVLAPNGNFVNIANLRNNFNAEPGWGLMAPGPDGTERRRMSTGLTLFQGGNGNDAGRSYDPGRPWSFNNIQQPVPVRLGEPSRNAHPLRPADWATNQIWAFRPMIDTEFDPGQYAYLFNQWADADGDGFADSRWFELVDLAGAFGNPAVPPRSILPTDGRVRYFVAARVVDASAMVNVNVASDMTRMPGQLSFLNKFDRDRVYLPGASPADLDLRRVMMRLDFDYDYHRYLGQAPRTGLGYVNIPRPESAGDIGDFSAYDSLNAMRLGSAGYQALLSFRLRGSSLLPGVFVTSLGSIDGTLDESVQGPRNGLRPTPIYDAWDKPQPRSTDIIQPPPGYTFANVRPGPTLSPLPTDLRLAAYSYLSSRPTNQYDPGIYNFSFTGGVESSSAPIYGGVFGMDDELDLRKFNGANDSTATSQLESVVAGRSASTALSLSPLRDNRPLSLELQGREFGGARPYRHLFGAPADEVAVSTDGVASRRDEVLVGYFGDIRRLLTTRSGARPIVESTSFGALSDADLAIDLTQPLKTLRAGGPRLDNRDYDRTAALRTVFDVYTRSLLPFGSADTILGGNPADPADRAYPSLWPDLTVHAADNDVAWARAAGLAWGGRAEIAARTSMHLALNLADALDVDYTALQGPFTFPVGGGANRDGQPPDLHEPAAVTLLMYARPPTSTANYRDLLDTLPDNGRVSARYSFPFPRVYLPERISPPVLAGDDDKAVAKNLASARAINVFGVEPQPVLIEAGSIFMFTDAPNSAGGDTEAGPQSGPVGGPPVDSPITIDFTPRLNNADFLGEIFAIQVTNPFDDPIDVFRDPPITGPYAGQEIASVRHYARIGQRCFLLAEQDETGFTINRSKTITLQPGETRVFYAINPGTRQQLKERIRVVAEAIPSSTGGPSTLSDPNWFENFIENQLGRNAVQMPMIQPFEPMTAVDGKFPAENATPTGSSVQSEFMDLWSTQRLPAPSSAVPSEFDDDIPPGQEGRRRVVSLYRVLRSSIGPYLKTSGDLTGTRNDPGNDLLVDRLRDPTGTSASEDGVLFGRRPTGSRTGNKEITGTVAGTETSGGRGLQDNTGFSVLFWGAVRRPTGELTQAYATAANSGTPPQPAMAFMDAPVGSVAGATPRPRLGILPPWCIENKSDNDAAYGAPIAGTDRKARWSLNAIEKVKKDGPGDRSDYDTSGDQKYERFKSVRAMLGLSTNTTGGTRPPAGGTTTPRAANEQITKSAYLKTGNPIPPNYDGNFTTPAGENRRRQWVEVAPEFHTVGFDDLAPDPNVGSNGQKRRSSRNSALFSRVGDLLLPLAVGPWQDPLITAGDVATGSPANIDPNAWTGGSDEVLLTQELRWTTLGEAIALATGYYSPTSGRDDSAVGNATATPPVPVGAQRAKNLWANFGFSVRPEAKPTDTGPLPAFTTLDLGARLDRGHLRLDRFSPYRLLNGNALPTAAADFEPLGPGVPFAFNVLSNARIAYGVGTTLDDLSTNPTYLSRESAPGGTAELSPGLLNINTAVRETVSTVPLLRPPPDVAKLNTGAAGANIVPDWTAGRDPRTPNAPLVFPELGIFAPPAATYTPATQPFNQRPAPIVFETPNLNTFPPANVRQDYDVATTLLAYRDKMAMIPRPYVIPSLATSNNRSIDFSTTVNPLGTGPQHPIRAQRASIPALRETLGFRSLGEILAVNYQARPNGAAPGTNPVVRPEFSMSRFAERLTPIYPAVTPNTVAFTSPMPGADHPSIQPSRYVPRNPNGTLFTNFISGGGDYLRPALDPGSGAALQTWPLVNETVSDVAPTYASKLAIATAAAGTISVRSDVFVVYFVVHGYTPEDVIVNDDPAAGPVEPMTPSIAKRFVMVVDRSNVVSPGDSPRVLMLQEVPLAR